MSGQHLDELRRRAAGMNSESVSEAAGSWRQHAKALLDVEIALRKAAPEVKLGFGAREIGTTAETAFLDAAADVHRRAVELTEGAVALTAVAKVLKTTEALAQQAPSAPGPAPQPPTYGDEAPLPAQQLVYASQMIRHNDAVAEYTAADAAAQQQLAALDKTFGEASEVFIKIHGDPEVPAPTAPTSGGAGGGGGVPPMPTTGGRSGGGFESVLVAVPQTPHPGHVTPNPTGGIDPGPPYVPVPVGPTDPGPQVVSPPAAAGGQGGGGVNPAVLAAGAGALGAGAFAAAKGVGGLRAAIAARGAGGAGTIGASSRTGAPGSLTRGSGAATPGSQTGRAGAAGRGGVPGSQAGRGGAGGRGAGAGAAGGRGGRKRDDAKGAARDLFDDGSDWIDDEGAGPGVLD